MKKSLDQKNDLFFFNSLFLWFDTSTLIKEKTIMSLYNPETFSESFVFDTFFCQQMIQDEVNKV
jgi:hypothetical protein